MKRTLIITGVNHPVTETRLCLKGTACEHMLVRVVFVKDDATAARILPGEENVSVVSADIIIRNAKIPMQQGDDVLLPLVELLAAIGDEGALNSLIEPQLELAAA